MMEQAAWQESESPVTEGTQAGNLCFGDAMNEIPILNGRLDWETTRFFSNCITANTSVSNIFFSMWKKKTSYACLKIESKEAVERGRLR